MITDTAADGVEFIFGTAFKEDMQDEMMTLLLLPVLKMSRRRL